MTYAKGTKTSIATSEEQIKAMLRKAGAEQMAFGEARDHAIIAFHLDGRSIRFRLPLPARDEERFTHYQVVNQRGAAGKLTLRTEDAAARLWVQACRERWRQLHLCIKAKLESVEQNIELFDDAFLSQIVTPDGTTIGEKVKPQMVALMDGQPLRPLLEGPR